MARPFGDVEGTRLAPGVVLLRLVLNGTMNDAIRAGEEAAAEFDLIQSLRSLIMWRAVTREIRAPWSAGARKDACDREPRYQRDQAVGYAFGERSTVLSHSPTTLQQSVQRHRLLPFRRHPPAETGAIHCMIGRSWKYRMPMEAIAVLYWTFVRRRRR